MILGQCDTQTQANNNRKFDLSLTSYENIYIFFTFCEINAKYKAMKLLPSPPN